MTESCEGVGVGEEVITNFRENYYWAYDHDPVAWVQEFQTLVKEAHTGKKKNKQALAKYRAMRMDIAAQTARFTIESPNSEKPGKDDVAVSITGCRGGIPHADPIAVAAYTGCPLLVPVHHGGPSPDGDLESECYRRVSPDGWPGKGKPVVRGLESDGYPTFGNNSQCYWEIDLIKYPHPLSVKPGQLLVRQGREQLESSLCEAIIESNCHYHDGIVVTGLPFCRRNGYSDDTGRASAELSVNAFQKAGVRRIVLAGKYATDTAAALQSFVEASGLEITISLWKGAREDSDESHECQEDDGQS